MTRRRSRPPAVIIGACLALLIAADLAVWAAVALLHLAVFLVLPAIAGLVAYRAGRRRALPPPRVVRGVVVPPGDRFSEVEAERDELRSEVAALRADLADARESAQAAWDTAASRPPRPRPEPGDATRRLLAAPMSGVRPLFPGGGQ